MKRNFTQQPYEECTKHNRCKSICPLDITYFSNAEHETTCTLERSVRVVIARTHPGVLSFGGLTKTEFNDLLQGRRTL
jgi:hypothetical protein